MVSKVDSQAWFTVNFYSMAFPDHTHSGLHLYLGKKTRRIKLVHTKEERGVFLVKKDFKKALSAQGSFWDLTECTYGPKFGLGQRANKPQRKKRGEG